MSAVSRVKDFAQNAGTLQRDESTGKVGYSSWRLFELPILLHDFHGNASLGQSKSY
jgi:hypothetical protein